MKCQYCECHDTVSYYDDKRICENCYEAFRKVGLSKMKKDYLKVVEEKGYLENKLGHYKDYINCLEKEKKYYRNELKLYKENKTIERLEKELKEKEEEIEGLKKNIERFKNSHALSVAITTIDDYEKIVKEKDEKIEELERKLRVAEKDVSRHYHNSNFFENKVKELGKELALLKNKENDIIDQINELTNFISVGNKYNKGKVGMRTSDACIELIKEKNEEIEKKNRLIKHLEEVVEEYRNNSPQYEEWCELKYWFINSVTGQTNMYRQHMNYEDACELIGMDSDNWIEFNVVKYKKEVK